MPVRVAVNGFGRIGRNMLRAAKEQGADIEWVAINDVADTDTLAHLLKYDSILGPYKGTVEQRQGVIAVDGQEIEMLAERAAQLPPAAAREAATLIGRREALLQSIGPAGGAAPHGLRIRCHGDYHLGQVLLRRNDFVITDFEGAADQDVAERRRKRSPLTDVAAMLRSFAYARRMALQQCSLIAAEERLSWEPQLDEWESQARREFLAAYDEIARGAGLYASFEEMAPLLELAELDTALADLRRELISRPEWAVVPLRRLSALAQ